MAASGPKQSGTDSPGQNQPDVLLEDLCFDAQQASEKALKALFVLKRWNADETDEHAFLAYLPNPPHQPYLTDYGSGAGSSELPIRN